MNNSHWKWWIREIYNFSFDMKHANDFSLSMFDDWSKSIIIIIIINIKAKTKCEIYYFFSCNV